MNLSLFVHQTHAKRLFTFKYFNLLQFTRYREAALLSTFRFKFKPSFYREISNKIEEISINTHPRRIKFLYYVRIVILNFIDKQFKCGHDLLMAERNSIKVKTEMFNKKRTYKCVIFL